MSQSHKVTKYDHTRVSLEVWEAFCLWFSWRLVGRTSTVRLTCSGHECSTQRPAQVEAFNRGASSGYCWSDGASDGNDQLYGRREKSAERRGEVCPASCRGATWKRATRRQHLSNWWRLDRSVLFPSAASQKTG